MSEQDVETVDFGSTAGSTASDTPRSSGGTAHRAGYMEAPALVEGTSREDAEGAVRPMVGPVLEG